MTADQDQDRAARAAEELVRRPLSRQQQRQADRIAAGAAELARQLQRQAASGRRRGR
jgi:hypothetical protein